MLPIPSLRFAFHLDATVMLLVLLILSHLDAIIKSLYDETLFIFRDAGATAKSL